MAFAGNCGVEVDFPAPAPAPDALPADWSDLQALFAEELGWLLEVSAAEAEAVVAHFAAAGVAAVVIGRTLAEDAARVSVGGRPALSAPMTSGCNAPRDGSGAPPLLLLLLLLLPPPHLRLSAFACPAAALRDTWEATSFELERRQCALDCVAEEQVGGRR